MATLELVSHDTYLSTSEVEGDGRYLPVTHTTVNTESFRLSSLPLRMPFIMVLEISLVQRILRYKEQSEVSFG
jgi:hypothetical protein